MNDITEELDKVVDALENVMVIHERTPNGCAECGDLTWPCTTILVVHAAFYADPSEKRDL